MIRSRERGVVFFCLLLCVGGCTTPAPHREVSPGSPGVNPEPQGFSEEYHVPPAVEGKNQLEETAVPAPTQEGKQHRIDAAMDFYQTADELWEQGDLDKALESLDKAYALILQVGPEADQNILQQKEDLRFTIAKRIMEVYASRFRVVNGHQNAIPCVMNKHVQAALDSFKTIERSFFMDAYIRSGKYRPMILKILREEGLPEELSWLPLIESGFKVRALSCAGALGLWQFIASTGYKFGLERNAWVDDRMDPVKSTRAAIAYFKELHGIFGDWTTALAAYNCGEANVLRVIREQRIKYLDNFWDLYNTLPYETASYVPKFIAMLHIIKDPEKYGFSLPQVDEPMEITEVIIDKQIHLKTLAEHMGISYQELLDLNPELRRDITPAEPYTLKVPKAMAEKLVVSLEDVPLWVPPVPSYVMHRVLKDQTLSSIASTYKTSVKTLMALNGLKSTHLKKGMTLKIPSRSGTTYAKIHAPLPSKNPKESMSEYVVKKGDSLWTIANRFNTTTTTIQSLNQLKTTGLSIGQVLLVPKNKKE